MHWTILVVYPFFSICWNTFQKAFSCHITYDLLQILQHKVFEFPERKPGKSVSDCGDY